MGRWEGTDSLGKRGKGGEKLHGYMERRKEEEEKPEVWREPGSSLPKALSLIILKFHPG